MVMIKIAAILIFCFGAARAINTDNWHPFAPNGFPGILTGASIVFFTYIGFDSVSTAAEECRSPQRDMPFGIIATLIICTILYGAVALVLTGIAQLEDAGPGLAGGRCAEDARLQPAAADRHGRRADGNDLVAAGLSIRAGANLVRDVARPPAARTVFESASQVSDAAHQHLDRGIRGRDSRGHCGTSTPSPSCRTSARCSRSSWYRRA